MFAICVRVCLLCRYSMRGARNFFQRGSRPGSQKTVWTTFFFLFFVLFLYCPQLILQLTEGSNGVITKKIILFQ